MPRHPCTILQNTIDKKELEFRVLAAGVGLVVLPVLRKIIWVTKKGIEGILVTNCFETCRCSFKVKNTKTTTKNTV